MFPEFLLAKYLDISLTVLILLPLFPRNFDKRTRSKLRGRSALKSSIGVWVNIVCILFRIYDDSEK